MRWELEVSLFFCEYNLLLINQFYYYLEAAYIEERDNAAASLQPSIDLPPSCDLLNETNDTSLDSVSDCTLSNDREVDSDSDGDTDNELPPEVAELPSGTLLHALFLFTTYFCIIFNKYRYCSWEPIIQKKIGCVGCQKSVPAQSSQRASANLEGVGPYTSIGC